MSKDVYIMCRFIARSHITRSHRHMHKAGFSVVTMEGREGRERGGSCYRVLLVCNDLHSLQFTINKIVYKIFGAMSNNLYIEISAHFGIESVENLVVNRRNCFINRYGKTDNYLFQMLR